VFPGLVAIHQDRAGRPLQTPSAYATGIGCRRAGVIPTTFAEETETDLSASRRCCAVGVTASFKPGFETLTEAGTPTGDGVLRVSHELKAIVDLIYRGASLHAAFDQQ